MLANPQRFIILFAALQAFASLSIDITLPAMPTMAADLLASETSVQSSISIFSLGLFLGMMLYGPLSDKYGRRPLMLGGIGLYILSTLVCVFADSVTNLVFWRFMQAFGGAAAAVLSRAIVRDVFAPIEVARVLSLMQLVSMIAVMVAPLCGAYLLSLGSWRWIFVFLSVFAIITAALVVLKVPETHIEGARVDSLRATFKTYLVIYTDRKALGYVMAMAMCFSGMFAYITVSPFVFIEFYGLSTYEFSLIFGVNTFGVLLLSMLNAQWVRAKGSQYMLRIGASVCLLSGALLLTCLVIENHFWLLIVGLFLLVSCVALMGANSIASLMNMYPQNSGAAAGLAVANQFGVGAAVAMLASAIYDGTSFALALVIGVCGLATYGAFGLTQLSKHSTGS